MCHGWTWKVGDLAWECGIWPSVHQVHRGVWVESCLWVTYLDVSCPQIYEKYNVFIEEYGL